MRQLSLIRATDDCRVMQQPLDFGCENKRGAIAVVIKRSGPDRIASQEQSATLGIEESQGEIAAQVITEPIADPVVYRRDEGRRFV